MRRENGAINGGSKGMILLKGLSMLPYILLMLSACGIDEDTGFAVVRELRIAAVIAEPAEPSPGESVHLKAVAVDPDSRELAYLWFIPPNVIEPDEGIPEGIEPIAWRDEFDWTVPKTSGVYTLIVLAVPVEYLPELVSVQKFEPLQNLPHAIAFKNLTISDSEIRNHNPVINEVVITPEIYNPGGRITVAAYASDSDNDELQYAWLSITPGLSSDYENPVEFRTPEDGSAAVIYLAVRDRRGGSTIKMIEIN